MLSSLLGAIAFLPGCLAVLTGIHAPAEVAVEQEFSVAVDASVSGHGGGMAALILQYPDDLELVGAYHVSDMARRSLRRNVAIARRFKAEEGCSIAALTDSVPQTRHSELAVRVILRFTTKQTGVYDLKFLAGVVVDDRGRQIWRSTDPAGVTDFADVSDERYAARVRVVYPERNGTAALALSGKREYLLLPDTGLFRLPLAKDFSLETWCRTSMPDIPLISARRDDFHGAHPFELAVNARGEAELRCADGLRSYTSTGGPFIADGAWHHLAVSYCADSVRYVVFVDGNPAATLLLPESMRDVSTRELFVGTNAARRQFAVAEFEELRLWENCRNEQEVDYYKDLPLGGFESNLYALFSFDSGADGMIPAQSQIEGLAAFAYNRPRLIVSTAPLRLEFLAFNAVLADREVQMSWETFDESKVLSYEVEKRSESGRYTPYRHIEPQRDPSRHQVYTVTDTWDGRTIMYYRLRKIATDGSAVFSAETPIGAEAILNFTLEDNTPNPFTDSTQIHFTVHRRTRVELAVYDMMGREIRTLVNERKEPGSYSVIFSAGDIPGGMYFYKMKTGAGSQTKKMYLAR
jgi:hypothetical protein